MDWTIEFISKENFMEHVRKTIANYGETWESYDVRKWNSNIIDPIKMIFDKSVYGENWQDLISSEIFRQRDKSNTNEIGYFHQKLFRYVNGCRVPDNGTEGGWDVIYEVPSGYTLDNGNVVHKIYVEMKNKHNTMNSSAAGKTYIKMQNQLLQDDDCACFLVEAIAKRSQNIIWKTTVDKQKVSHARIRRVSIDKFYEIVTGQSDAFYQVCMALPHVVQEVLSEQNSEVMAPHDTVYEELQTIARRFDNLTEDTAMIMSMYMLGFSTYNGFESIAGNNDE